MTKRKTVKLKKKRRTGKAGKPTVELIELRIKAIELRKSGATYEQIALALGYASRGAAYNAVMAGLMMAISEPAESVREMEAMRLDALLLGLWQKARSGDLQVIDRVLKIMDRRARLLGLDAPAKIETDNTGTVKHEHDHKVIEIEQPSDERAAEILRILVASGGLTAEGEGAAQATMEQMDPAGTD